VGEGEGGGGEGKSVYTCLLHIHMCKQLTEGIHGTLTGRKYICKKLLVAFVKYFTVSPNPGWDSWPVSTADQFVTTGEE
jgi:hypothetical protein